MAMPTKEKTWQYVVNTAAYVSPSLMLYDIKNILCTFGSSPWTVVRSNDRTSVADSDLWINSSKVSWLAGDQKYGSWIVLKQTGVASNFQVLIACWEYDLYTVGYGVVFYVSENAGFTGGTTTTRPTATDEVFVSVYDEYAKRLFYPWGTPSSFPARLHVMQSTDGQCTRIAICNSAACSRLTMFEKAKSPISGWTIPWVAVNGSSGTLTAVTYSKLNDRSDSACGRNPSGGVAAMYLASEGWGAATVGEQITFPDDDTVEYPLSPVVAACETLGFRGMKGYLYDLWWGSTAPATGDTYPGDGSKTFAQFGHLILPWNGTTPLT